ncbi:MAG: 5'-3' exonuclease H3TH domain-containing protein [Gammaproteobacteria bacterium]
MIYLVDASVYVRRAYHSLPLEMTDRDGNPAHAVFGFARVLGDLIERARPKYIAVAFDQSLMRCFRNRIYPAYKANRDPHPADLALQFKRCMELCRCLGITALASQEYEADDIIGTLVTSMRREGVRSTVITRDKDLAQLIREGDVYWDFGGREPFGYHDIERHFGVAPERFADYLALMGDAVDNIPGIPGIGPKTAAALMKEFASLDELYGDLERVVSLKMRGAIALGARLRQHRDAAYLARQLTGIMCEVPLGLGTDGLRRRAPDLPALRDFYDGQGFGPLPSSHAPTLL